MAPRPPGRRAARPTTGRLWPMNGWWRSAGYAWSGIAHTYRTQRNFRAECLLGVVAVLLTLLLRAPLAPILLSCGLVLSLELANTALEAVVDLVSPQRHPLARVAKDAAAGAVLAGSAAALLTGAAVLGPPLLRLLLRVL